MEFTAKAQVVIETGYMGLSPGGASMRKVVTVTLLAWTLWWTQEQVGEPEKYRLLTTLRPLSVHDNQAACETAAEKARVSQTDLYTQSLASFGWKKFPSYMQRENTFTCKSA
jgi:hypothetical protein